VADHARWLLKRVTAAAATQISSSNEQEGGGSLCRGRCEKSPASPTLFLAGHSAGGAVVFEAAILLASWGISVRGVSLMDGVPWPRTISAASRFHSQRTSLLAVRSMPSSWNKEGAIMEALTAVPSPPAVVVLLPHSQHGDPILPRPWPAWALRAAGLLGPELCTQLYADLLAEFVSCQADINNIVRRVQQLALEYPGEVETVGLDQASSPPVSHELREATDCIHATGV
jgi:hypothetical protein